MSLDGLLGGLRTIQNRYLPDSCVISRTAAGTADDWGGTASGTTSTVATVACRVTLRSEARPNVQPVGGGAEILTPWQIRMPEGTDVRPKDVITSGGRSFEVQQVTTGQSYETVRVAYCTSEAS